MFRAACIQINSGNDIAENLEKISRFVRGAARSGAEFITLPENALLMSKNPEELFASKASAEQNLPALKDIAKSNNIWLLVGSIAYFIEEANKFANRSYLINNHGDICASYDKINLYDAQVKGGETHRESDRFISGSEVVTAKTPWGNLGFTICYDLRFPNLFCNLVRNGAEFITVPAAFTEFTGRAHWHVLLRARAIETNCYIIAPAQTGVHPSGRATYGHSLIIDPWGRIIAECGKDEGFIVADIDVDMVHDVRAQIPKKLY